MSLQGLDITILTKGFFRFHIGTNNIDYQYLWGADSGANHAHF